jgi:DNA polymerase-1
LKYLTFSDPEQTTYEICFLVPQLNRAEILRHYVDPYFGGEKDKILAYDLFKEGKKTLVARQKEYLEDLLPVLMDLQVKYLVVADAEYFKTLTKTSSADKELGYVHECVVGDFKVIYCPNFRSVFYNPDKVKAEIRVALSAVQNHRTGSYDAPGLGIIKFAAYPDTAEDIKAWLDKLIEMDCDLTADIEGFGLKHYEAGIGTISFAWSQHEGIAFPVDLHPHSHLIRKHLKDFFLRHKRSMKWQKINYDVYVLIYQLFMKDLLDTEGLLTGLEVMLRNWDCTRLITYLATNSCSGNQLGLKQQAQEFAGNWAVEKITDIRKIPLPDLLQYNLVDSLSTWYVFNKHYPTVIKDEQLEIYETLFKPAMVDIIQMQLTGMPLNRERVIEVNTILQDIADGAVREMQSSVWIQRFEEMRRIEWRDKKHLEWKKKRIELHEVPVCKDTTFNPNSNPQLQRLLYDPQFFGLPVLDLTDSKLPSTGGDTLKKLVNHTDDPEIKAVLLALIEYAAVEIILTNFMPSFLAAPEGPDGWHWLFGFFNLGGTLSGRLSSSEPNLQNIPANVAMKLSEALLAKYGEILKDYLDKGKLVLGKLIKSCFEAPPGWLFCGLDFASLEDRISALTTKDPNKLKVYTDGYDGHSLRAYAYFSEHMPDIDPTSVESINSIEKKYKPFRQDSKAPTFALTYQGTYMTLMNNCGFTEELAKLIEKRYHEMYVISDKWVQDRLDLAAKTGYVTAAFGLRVRTPLLHQVIRGTSRTPFEAEAEGRTAGNALGQSWCLLNSRAGSEFMGRVRKEKHRLNIRPCAQIHDAGYFLIRDDLAALAYTNEHLVKAVQWQEHPDIQHDEVKLGGELSIFYPTWAVEMNVPNGAKEEDIQLLAQKHVERFGLAA